MTYVKQTWTDNVTPVDKAHMDHIEDGIVAVDARPTIPTVVNGQWLKGVSGAAVWSAITPADVGVPKVTRSASTSPPASPADGDIWIMSFTPNLNQSGAVITWWQFVWSTSLAVWMFVGGPPVEADIDGSQTIATGTLTDLGGPYCYVPRGGDYYCDFGCVISPTAQSSVANAQMVLVKISDASYLGSVYASPYPLPAGGYYISMSRSLRSFVIGAGDGLHTRYNISNGASCSFANRYIRFWPRYVT